MKKKYFIPSLTVVLVAPSDLITTSLICEERGSGGVVSLDDFSRY